MNERKYQIFISSTYEDLREEREAAIKTILSLYHIPIGMEMFNAGDSDQWTVISRTIETSDYYVVIIGERYGSTIDSGVSYTENEYDYALSKGVPVLAFIKDENSSSTPAQRETDTNKQERLLAFREKAKKKYADFWKTKDDFTTKLSISLHKAFSDQPRTGWVSAKQDITLNDGLSKTELIELIKKTIHNEIKPMTNEEIDEIIKDVFDRPSNKPYVRYISPDDWIDEKRDYRYFIIPVEEHGKGSDPTVTTYTKKSTGEYTACFCEISIKDNGDIIIAIVSKFDIETIKVIIK